MTVVPIVTDAMVVEEAARSVYCSQNCVAHADVLATWTAVSEFVAFSLKANKVRRARSSPFCLIHPSSLQRRCTVDMRGGLFDSSRCAARNHIPGGVHHV
jgi:hypothetical protein